jgi:hypothetical protein
MVEEDEDLLASRGTSTEVRLRPRRSRNNTDGHDIASGCEEEILGFVRVRSRGRSNLGVRGWGYDLVGAGEKEIAAGVSGLVVVHRGPTEATVYGELARRHNGAAMTSGPDCGSRWPRPTVGVGKSVREKGSWGRGRESTGVDAWRRRLVSTTVMGHNPRLLVCLRCQVLLYSTRCSNSYASPVSGAEPRLRVARCWAGPLVRL